MHENDTRALAKDRDIHPGGPVTMRFLVLWITEGSVKDLCKANIRVILVTFGRRSDRKLL